MTRQLLPFALALMLAGCFGSAPPVPRDHYYRLLVPGPAESRTEAPFRGVMMVDELRADGLLRERPLLYSASGASHEVQQHEYHFWSDAPPRMLQDQMVGFLRRGGIATTVVTPEMRVRADYEVSGKVKRMERLLAGGPPRVVVEVELALTRVSDGALVMVDSFTGEEDAEGGGVAASVLAINRATRRIFEKFLARAMLAAHRGAAVPQAARGN
jgi:ABC-type uncharacterized transport system auxiliary subunit